MSEVKYVRNLLVGLVHVLQAECDKAVNKKVSIAPNRRGEVRVVVKVERVMSQFLGNSSTAGSDVLRFANAPEVFAHGTLYRLIFRRVP